MPFINNDLIGAGTSEQEKNWRNPEVKAGVLGGGGGGEGGDIP